jgi:LysM repeat protein
MNIKDIRQAAFRGNEEATPENKFLEGAADWASNYFGNGTDVQAEAQEEFLRNIQQRAFGGQTIEEYANISRPTDLQPFDYMEPTSGYAPMESIENEFIGPDFNQNEVFEQSISRGVDPTLANYTGADFPIHLDSQYQEPTRLQRKVSFKPSVDAFNETVQGSPGDTAATDRLDTRQAILKRQGQEQQLGISQKTATSSNASQRLRTRATNIAKSSQERAPYKRELLVELDRAKAALDRHNNNPANIYDKVRTERGGRPSLIQSGYIDEINRIQNEIDTMDAYPSEATTPEASTKKVSDKSLLRSAGEGFFDLISGTAHAGTGERKLNAVGKRYYADKAERVDSFHQSQEQLIVQNNESKAVYNLKMQGLQAAHKSAKTPQEKKSIEAEALTLKIEEDKRVTDAYMFYKKQNVSAKKRERQYRAKANKEGKAGKDADKFLNKQYRRDKEDNPHGGKDVSSIGDFLYSKIINSPMGTLEDYEDVTIGEWGDVNNIKEEAQASGFISEAQASEAPTEQWHVQKGDTLSSIAKTLGTSVEALLKSNPDIKDKNNISVGQKLNTQLNTQGVPAPETPVVSDLSVLQEKYSDDKLDWKTLGKNKINPITGLDGSIARRNRNPGALKLEFGGAILGNTVSKLKRTRGRAIKDAKKAYDGVVTLDRAGFIIFDSVLSGQAAQKKLLINKHKGRTIEEMLPKYAIKDGSGDTHNAAYARRIHAYAKSQGVDLKGKKIGEMSEKEIRVLTRAMAKVEGGI